MRLCRYQDNGHIEIAFFTETSVVPLGRLATELGVQPPTASTNLLDYLPPDGKAAARTAELFRGLAKLKPEDVKRLALPSKDVKLRVSVVDPKKVILLAGNYAAHILEGGGQAAERQDTFPYFFWKPPTTTLTHPNDPIRIPKVSPNHVDWEVELGVIIGRKCRDVSEKEALSFVAGYTVCNDVSDRNFQINPGRKAREKDRYFDWLHGKWHDTFLPTGPCLLAAGPDVDPQKMSLKLRVNGQTMQDASTAQMIFPVAAIVSILSSFTALEPGDLIVTGTPSGVGHARKPPVYLKAGDMVEAEISGIGVLRNPVQ